MRKTILLLVLGLIAAGVSHSCKESPKLPGQLIIGTWRSSSNDSADSKGRPQHINITFTKELTFSSFDEEEPSDVKSGKYTISGETDDAVLTLIMDNSDAIKEDYLTVLVYVKFTTDDQMVWTLKGGDDTVYWWTMDRMRDL